jgi:hypothetical protein
MKLIYCSFVFLLLMVSSCGPSLNESWVMDNTGTCTEIPYSWSRITFYHLSGGNTECQYMYGRNTAGFMYDEYMECNFGSDGIWHYFRTEEECLQF